MIKNRDLFILKQGLLEVNQLSGKSENRVKFAIDLAKNLSIIENEIELFQTEMVEPEDFKEFSSKRMKLLEENSNKDDNGKPITTDLGNGSLKYDIIDEKSFAKKEVGLREEFKDVIDSREKQIKEYSILLEEECKLELRMIKSNTIPDDINGRQMTLIEKIIEE